ncbi:acetyl-CoA carboxylase biotin carboxyl carrier protein [Reichenbachiella sp. MALMAid0571]|uniref:acetyl-CoA carboxylase biotin carboxyl carrier protein n=1 Tax=Reichenbachiella sp. MALMAid0571 TaxID=3143939 RepID=UPI0032DE7685
MKIKEIKDLIDFLSASGLEEVNIETEELKIKIKRSKTQVIEKSVSTAPTVQAATPVAAAPAPVVAPVVEANTASTNYIEIKSPMIGTFYRSANPESDVFVSVGDEVSVGKTVCIIEAMKLFNEIESEVSGKIVKILVENAQPVEYDQPLFLVDPS